METRSIPVIYLINPSSLGNDMIYIMPVSSPPDNIDRMMESK